jgi:hypothetical protein
MIHGEWSLVARCEDHCHAVMLCFYFHYFMRTQKTLAVIPAIAAGIADEVLHEVGCAALMKTKRLLFVDLTRSGLPKSKFQIEALPNFEPRDSED